MTLPNQETKSVFIAIDILHFWQTFPNSHELYKVQETYHYMLFHQNHPRIGIYIRQYN